MVRNTRPPLQIQADPQRTVFSTDRWQARKPLLLSITGVLLGRRRAAGKSASGTTGVREDMATVFGNTRRTGNRQPGRAAAAAACTDSRRTSSGKREPAGMAGACAGSRQDRSGGGNPRTKVDELWVRRRLSLPRTGRAGGKPRHLRPSTCATWQRMGLASGSCFHGPVFLALAAC